MADTVTPLKRILTSRKLKVVEVANDVGTSAAQISRLATGKRRMTPYWAGRIAQSLDIDAEILLDEHGRPSVPLTTPIFRHGSSDSLDPDELGPPFERITALNTLEDPEECFAAEVLDSSADRLYPKGSILIARRLEAPARLRQGKKVIVERYVQNYGNGARLDTLVGMVQISITGGLQVTMASNDRALLGAIQIQPSALDNGRGIAGLNEAAQAFNAEAEYTPRADDPAAIVGVVEIAIITEA